MKFPVKTVEKKLFESGYGYVCAVDEVGMGCLAGPVVVCAVGMTNTFHKKIHKKLRNLRESKLLNPAQREAFASWLVRDQGLVYALAVCSPRTIDKINIYEAARRAMRQALKKIRPPFALKTVVLVDGKHPIQGVEHDQHAIVAGDRKVFAIACASVLAKVHRDRLMKRYAKKFPGYGFERHMGYGTKHHYACLTELGPCPIHRRSFRLT
ncbi:MAG TPA: ribonuclease HII [Candidatus Paceibacterota bacterium]|nr:ribonuclease HII [Candidatus Paceibacterota bacterium]